MDFDGGKRVFNRLGPNQQTDNRNQKVCFHWRAGNCNRFPCPFLHRELSAPANGTASSKRPYGFATDDQRSTMARRGGGGFNTWGRGGGGRGGNVLNNNVVKKDKICNFWVQGSCSYGEKCRYLHSWCTGGCFAMLTQLEGHQKVVSGIALPVGSDKLYTGSRDETVRVWDCQSGQCAGVIKVGGEVGCMLSEGPWMFVGLPNLVKAWNVQTSAELSLNGPVGQVYSLVVGNDLLFAGTQDGSILAWKYNAASNCFEPAASLQGHTSAVVTLVVGANRLYSGSMDKSIRVWNLENLQCLQTLTDHRDVVMSVLCWDQFLLSCSLDKTIKVWAATESGNLEVTYTHNEDHGLLNLCGMHDLESKPVLLCSGNDNTVRAYDLPSFAERGKIYAKQEIRSIHGGPNIFFTGDGTGEVRVWQWLADQSATTTPA
ncbi:putative transcription factor C3H family [Helianthus annuus]|uniref:Putative transducin/WD40 repeat-like superfamily protein n=1 Tax=Helianthus annuus TaxID=4232 RepID=A0A251URA5_HELAN|nr:zinc finger CCCH domain-containing protein 63 isoform X1 [Helianthus annuus]KAF5805532.1 putative transcription factor C3H family [Helianthus annuus]KAJ0922425.1 putative transcription factor C3H family [Helianthus annuus]